MKNKIKRIKKSWEFELYNTLKNHGVRQIPFVPDAGHSVLINLIEKDPDMKSIVLTTEEEGVAICCGAWLGGHKSILLMQSSGVGNCINMFSLLTNGNFPFVTLVTMRGEFGEFNSWQVPMGKAVKKNLKSMGIEVYKCNSVKQVVPTVEAALYAAYSSDQQIAVLFSQKLIGKKEW